MFDQFAEEYLQHAKESPRSLVGRAAVLSVLGDIAGLNVLDLGCGPGLYAAELIARGDERVVGVDGSPNMVRLASERVHGPVTFRQQDLEEPMAWAGDGEFDVAVLPLVTEALDRAATEGITDPHQLQQIVRRTVGKWVNDTYRRRPMIVPNVVEV